MAVERKAVSVNDVLYALAACPQQREQQRGKKNNITSKYVCTDNALKCAQITAEHEERSQTR